MLHGAYLNHLWCTIFSNVLYNVQVVKLQADKIKLPKLKTLYYSEKGMDNTIVVTEMFVDYLAVLM